MQVKHMARLFPLYENEAFEAFGRVPIWTAMKIWREREGNKRRNGKSGRKLVELSVHQLLKKKKKMNISKHCEAFQASQTKPIMI